MLSVEQLDELALTVLDKTVPNFHKHLQIDTAMLENERLYKKWRTTGSIEDFARFKRVYQRYTITGKWLDCLRSTLLHIQRGTQSTDVEREKMRAYSVILGA